MYTYMEHLKPDSGKVRILKQLEHSLGKPVLTALSDPKTVEVMLNPDGTLWHEVLGKQMVEIGRMEPSQAESVINIIAAYYGRVIEKDYPFIEAELPTDGSRFSGQLPPLVLSPTFSIRKHASEVFPISAYVENGIMTQTQADALIASIKKRDNIIVVGGTTSGKTTLTNAILLEKQRLYPEERFVIIEDTAEIQSNAKNFVQYHTTAMVDMTRLVRIALRMNIKSIIVGEVRGGEALDVLDAWNTGHDGGVCTIHANSSFAGLTRLRSLVTRNKSAPKEIEPLIGEAIQLIVFIARTTEGRKVKEILRVSGYENGAYLTEKL
jgi:type IV secretion system protein TrbB